MSLQFPINKCQIRGDRFPQTLNAHDLWTYSSYFKIFMLGYYFMLP